MRKAMREGKRQNHEADKGGQRQSEKWICEAKRGIEVSK